MMKDEGKITNYKPQITNKPQKDKEQKNKQKTGEHGGVTVRPYGNS
jgi:hypothetical protein